MAQCSVVRVQLPAGSSDGTLHCDAAEGRGNAENHALPLDPEATIAHGTLQLLALPPPPDVVDEDESAAVVALAIASRDGGCSFFCLCPSGTAVFVAPGEACLIVLDPDDVGRGPARTVCGIVFEAGGLHDSLSAFWPWLQGEVAG